MAREVPGAAPAIIWCADRGEPPGPWRERACGDPRRVHPRARRAGPRMLAICAPVAGSPPRAQGGLCPPAVVGGVSGFIPARAGRAVMSRCGRCPRQVHPRACGATQHKTGFMLGRRWVHSRVRGVQQPCRTERMMVSGSSPRVRGNACRVPLLRGASWFLPARAGSMCPTAPSATTFAVDPPGGVLTATLRPRLHGVVQDVSRRGECSRVHPRACGVFVPGCVLSSIPTGSSPCVRGGACFGSSPGPRLWPILVAAGRCSPLLPRLSSPRVVVGHGLSRGAAVVVPARLQTPPGPSSLPFIGLSVSRSGLSPVASGSSGSSLLATVRSSGSASLPLRPASARSRVLRAASSPAGSGRAPALFRLRSLS